MSYFYFFLSITVLLVVLNKVNKKDRDKNPEKWKVIDAEKLRKDKLREAIHRHEAIHRQAREYDDAMQKIPPSQWMLMTKWEKAAALKRREDAASRGRGPL